MDTLEQHDNCRRLHLNVMKSVMLVFLCLAVRNTNAAEDGMQQQVSMTADGWKPILGNTRPAPSHYQEEIKYYQNPILKETVKAEPLPTTTPGPTPPTTTRLEAKTIHTIPISVNIIHQTSSKNGKIPPHSKHVPQYFVLPNHGSHGPHIPLNAVTHGRPGQQGVLKKNNVKNHSSNGKRIVKHPVKGFLTAHSNRNEVYVPAPSSGNLQFLSQGKNVRTRETPGLGIVGQKLYSIKQPHAHMEFSGHFPPNNIYQQIGSPVQHIIFQKQHINEVIPHYQIDTHTNLLPPPIFKDFVGNNPVKHIHNGKLNPDIHTPPDKIITGHNPLGPNDLILQLPSYEQSFFDLDKFVPQATKGKLEFQHDFSNHNSQDNRYHSFRDQRPSSEFPRSPTYEVTEGRLEDNTPLNRFRKPNSKQPLEFNLPPFLPTPYKADNIAPTSSTQDEVSTIFVRLSDAMKHKQNPFFFDVKEVSTHFPILGKPEIFPLNTESTEKVTEESTTKAAVDEAYQTTKEFSKPSRPHSQHRRRKPMNNNRYTTTEETETEKEVTPTSPPISEEPETEWPHRPKRPEIKIKPASSYSNEDSQGNINRHRKKPQQNDSRRNTQRKRTRPYKYQTEDDYIPKSTTEYVEPKDEEVTEVLPIIQHFTTQGFSDFKKKIIVHPTRIIEATTIKPTEHVAVTTLSQTDDENEESLQEPIIDNIESEKINIEKPSAEFEDEETIKENITIPDHENSKNTETSDLLKKFVEKKRNRTQSSWSAATEPSPTTSIDEPDNEININPTIKILNEIDSSDDIKKIITTTDATTIIVPAETTKPHRRRPIKYNASNRPKFSVKDYRQRLNQYSSTTTTTSTDTTKAPTSSDNVKVRFPTRLRRPIITSTTLLPTDETTVRTKFFPKEPRHSTPSPHEVITEKNVKAVNTRLRPFGRSKTTTQSTPVVTPKISIKPNLFSNRRRPTPISLKSRIQNRNNNTNSNDLDVENTTFNLDKNDENVSDTDIERILLTEEKPDATDHVQDLDKAPDAKNEASLYSQRVSDLTSSMNNDYEGFKTVPVNSRRIPNYYTLSTEDPILPIEAFFSKINEKGK